MIIQKTKDIYNKLPKFLRGIWGIVFIIILIVIGYFLAKPKVQSQYEYQTVVNSVFKSTVEGSGNVTTLKEVELKALSSGQITSLRVKPGDYVKKGQILANLDGRSALIQINQAKANYDKVLNGATTPDVQISKVALENAKASADTIKKQQDVLVINAYRTLLNSTLEAEAGTNVNQNNPIISGTYTCDREGFYKITLYKTGSGFYIDLAGMESGNFAFDSYTKSQPLGTCGLYIVKDTTKTYTGNEQWTVSIPNTKASNYGLNLNTYNSVKESRDKAVADALQNVKSAEATFNQKIAEARPEDLALYKASLDSAYLAYDFTLVKAPFDGEIGTVSAQVGEQVSNGANIATIITKSKIAEISLNEVDVAHIKIGQKVDLTFDSISDLILPGTVSEMDTLGKETSNVVTFKVKLSFDKDDERIRPGMSVTGNIITEEKNDVILVPNGSLKTENGKYYVETKDINSQDKNVPNKKIFVEIGLTNDTETEIVSGLTLGEEVVVRLIDTTTKVKSSSPFAPKN